MNKKTYRYKIAESVIEVNTDNRYIINRMKDFITTSEEEPILKLDLLETMPLILPSSGYTIAECLWWYKNEETGSYSVYWYEEDKQVIGMFEVTNDWKNAKVIMDARTMQKKPKAFTDYMFFQIAGLVYRNTVVDHDSIVFHCSALKHTDKGLMFTAPSGTGKSTHTGLWMEYKGEDTIIINDDSPTIRIIDDTPYIYGSPWSGSTDIFQNIKVKADAIIVLEQHKENIIEKLALHKAIGIVMPRLMLPYQDKDRMAKAMSVFDKIIAHVPTYKLKCRPDKDAVEKVYTCIM